MLSVVKYILVKYCQLKESLLNDTVWIDYPEKI